MLIYITAHQQCVRAASYKARCLLSPYNLQAPPTLSMLDPAPLPHPMHTQPAMAKFVGFMATVMQCLHWIGKQPPTFFPLVILF